MGITYVLYNPHAGGGEGAARANRLRDLYCGRQFEYIDITEIANFADFAETLEPSDEIIVCGGDGTLNRFINAIYDLGLKNGIFYYATGSGNDFLRDMGKEPGAYPFRINEYIANLPTVTVNGADYRFLNGVGYGIDGYCCEVGDELRKKGKTNINYSGIAVKGLLHGYKPTAATVTVDGDVRRYDRVWIAPTMHGCFYGGGMMPAPKQSRRDSERKVSLAVIHDSGKLKTLCVFPSIFKGGHTKHREMVDVFSGHDITVEFDRPTALQIDGETILGVTKYHVHSAASAEKTTLIHRRTAS